MEQEMHGRSRRDVGNKQKEILRKKRDIWVKLEEIGKETSGCRAWISRLKETKDAKEHKEIM